MFDISSIMWKYEKKNLYILWLIKLRCFEIRVISADLEQRVA